MSLRRAITLLLAILLLLPAAGSLTSCKAKNKVQCHSYGDYKSKKTKRNRSAYGTRYSNKAKPVRKPYVIKNKTTRITSR